MKLRSIFLEKLIFDEETECLKFPINLSQVHTTFCANCVSVQSFVNLVNRCPKLKSLTFSSFDCDFSCIDLIDSKIFNQLTNLDSIYTYDLEEVSKYCSNLVSLSIHCNLEGNVDKVTDLLIKT